MTIAKRIYISVPGDHVLNAAQQSLKWAIIDDVIAQKYIPEIFHSERPYPGSLAAGRGWTFQECGSVMKRCVGSIIIGLPRYVFAADERTLRLPTEYAHCEGSLGYIFDIPSLLLAEEGLEERGIFHWGGGQLITTFPQEVGKKWVSTDRYQTAFRLFKNKIDERRDIFLGYCSSSQGTAEIIKNFFERQLLASVLDWQTDFLEGRTIIEEIEEAAKRTSGGVFLFTRDDVLAGETQQGAPRDNVVFEAGFFAQSKGRERVLIIREDGAKMPADLGGSIYATLTDRANIDPLKQRMQRFLETAI
jgi:CAP12/Pycsar effector protein, TIR domain